MVWACWDTLFGPVRFHWFLRVLTLPCCAVLVDRFNMMASDSRPCVLSFCCFCREGKNPLHSIPLYNEALQPYHPPQASWGLLPDKRKIRIILRRKGATRAEQQQLVDAVHAAFCSTILDYFGPAVQVEPHDASPAAAAEAVARRSAPAVAAVATAAQQQQQFSGVSGGLHASSVRCRQREEGRHAVVPMAPGSPLAPAASLGGSTQEVTEPFSPTQLQTPPQPKRRRLEAVTPIMDATAAAVAAALAAAGGGTVDGDAGEGEEVVRRGWDMGELKGGAVEDETAAAADLAAAAVDLAAAADPAAAGGGGLGPGFGDEVEGVVEEVNGEHNPLQLREQRLGVGELQGGAEGDAAAAAGGGGGGGNDCARGVPPAEATAAGGSIVAERRASAAAAAAVGGGCGFGASGGRRVPAAAAADHSTGAAGPAIAGPGHRDRKAGRQIPIDSYFAAQKNSAGGSLSPPALAGGTRALFPPPGSLPDDHITDCPHHCGAPERSQPQLHGLDEARAEVLAVLESEGEGISEVGEEEGGAGLGGGQQVEGISDGEEEGEGGADLQHLEFVRSQRSQ